MKRHTVLVIAFLVLVTIQNAAAQSRPAETAVNPNGPEHSDLIHAVKMLQAQVSKLQHQLNASVGDTRMGIVADIAYGGLDEAIINGWAFKCGPTPFPGLLPQPYTLDVLVDGMPMPHRYNLRVDRPDVEELFTAYCGEEGMPKETGFSILVDMRHVSAGLRTFQVRIKDRRGVVLTSNRVTATNQ